jgi:hypothetical protein
MLAKAVILIFLLIIIFTLAFSFYSLVMDKGDSKRTVNRLTWRIVLSLFLMLLMYGMYQMGWIEPSSGPVIYQKAE